MSICHRARRQKSFSENKPKFCRHLYNRRNEKKCGEIGDRKTNMLDNELSYKMHLKK